MAALVKHSMKLINGLIALLSSYLYMREVYPS
jgi:hypothetical protein